MDIHSRDLETPMMAIADNALRTSIRTNDQIDAGKSGLTLNPRPSDSNKSRKPTLTKVKSRTAINFEVPILV